METISRDMRVGYDYKCLTLDTPEKSDCLSGSNSVQYTNSSGKIITYTFNKDTGPIISEKIDSGDQIALISRDSNVNISNMMFYVIGADNELTPSARTQPRVVITISGSIPSSTGDTSFNLQTNISQRVRK